MKIMCSQGQNHISWPWYSTAKVKSVWPCGRFEWIPGVITLFCEVSNIGVFRSGHPRVQVNFIYLFMYSTKFEEITSRPKSWFVRLRWASTLTFHQLISSYPSLNGHLCQNWRGFTEILQSQGQSTVVKTIMTSTFDLQIESAVPWALEKVFFFFSFCQIWINFTEMQCPL